MATTPKVRRVGRPSLTDSVKKRTKVRSNQGKINIYDSIDCWRKIGAEEGLNKDADIANLLINRYYQCKEQETGMSEPPSTPIMMSSTPAVPNTFKNLIPVDTMSDICSESDHGINMSGCHELSDQCPEVIDQIQRVREKRKGLVKRLSESFINPLDLSIGATSDEDMSENDGDDPDYEPSFNISSWLEESGMYDGDDAVLDDDEDYTEEEEEVLHVGDGINRVKTDDDINGLIEDTPCMTYYSQLLVLAMKKISSSCEVGGCTGPISMTKEHIGSALYLKWVCPDGHVAYKWCSQPLLNRRLHAGDFMIATSILLSGNNYAKVALFAKMLNWKIVCASTFHKIQRHYLVDAIDEYWLQHQKDILKKYENKAVVVLGDGRMDSPGYSAQYCSYTVMENESKDILSLVTMDKRRTQRKSTNLEKACFEQSMQSLLGKGVNIEEVVTDAHLQIGSLMKDVYRHIHHSHDMWHAAKNMLKKILKAGQDKKCTALQKWSTHIVNHFWYCAKNASTYEEFLDLWLGVLHHVVDEHSWSLPCVNTVVECLHGPLTEEAGEDRQWMVKGDDAHIALRKIVLDKRFLNNIHYYLNFRSTAELETFQQQILMYAGKRFAYSPPVYRVRNMLAAIDHNEHHGREVMTNKHGEVVYHRIYNKKSARWAVSAVKVAKTYSHINEMKRGILKKRLEDKEGMQRRRELEQNDPRRESLHLAPTTPPATSVIVQQQVSRRH